jgi:hypothetical protein
VRSARLRVQLDLSFRYSAGLTWTTKTKGAVSGLDHTSPMLARPLRGGGASLAC